MSRLIFQSSYIIILPSFPKAEMHRHPMLHLFYGSNGCAIIANGEKCSGETVVLDSDINHIAEFGNGCELFLLIDPTSSIAEQMKSTFFANGQFFAGCGSNVSLPNDLWHLSDEDIIALVHKLLLTIGIDTCEESRKDPRVEAVNEHIISGEWLNYKINEIARQVCLSESRLTHLFKSEMGISLKSYLVIRKMERAYKYVMSGGKIIHAAYEAGFSSSAHLAYTCKQLTGVSIREVLKS